MATLDQLDDDCTISIDTPATTAGSLFARRRIAVMHYLVGQGMLPGAIPQHRLDLTGVKEAGSGFAVPATFLARTKATHPEAFADTASLATFDAMKASREDVDRQLRDLATGQYRRQHANAAARDLADLERLYPLAA